VHQGRGKTPDLGPGLKAIPAQLPAKLETYMHTSDCQKGPGQQARTEGGNGETAAPAEASIRSMRCPCHSLLPPVSPCCLLAAGDSLLVLGQLEVRQAAVGMQDRVLRRGCDALLVEFHSSLIISRPAAQRGTARKAQRRSWPPNLHDLQTATQAAAPARDAHVG
jgi:hypothetical protein